MRTHTSAHTLINTPEKSLKCHPENRLITLHLISLREKGCGGKKGSKGGGGGTEGRKEGVKEGGSDGGLHNYSDNSWV